MSNWPPRGVDAIIVPEILSPTSLLFPPTVTPSCLLEATTNQVVTGIVTTTNRQAVKSLITETMEWSGTPSKMEGEQCEGNNAFTSTSCDASHIWCECVLLTYCVCSATHLSNTHSSR